jgi:hypothetical protein
MKGQIFVITAIMILLALFIARISTNTTDVKQESLFYESFSNIKSELTRTVDLALINGEDVSTRLDDFIDFSKDIYEKKGYVESVNYTISSGNPTMVHLNISLSSKDSYLLEGLTINRTVYS